MKSAAHIIGICINQLKIKIKIRRIDPHVCKVVSVYKTQVVFVVNHEILASHLTTVFYRFMNQNKK